MNNQGNNFDDETVSDYFKLKSGHYAEIDGIKLPRSIALDSGTTTQEMRTLIDIILEFGLDNEIEDCYIENQELDELLKYYENQKR